MPDDLTEARAAERKALRTGAGLVNRVAMLEAPSMRVQSGGEELLGAPQLCVACTIISPEVDKQQGWRLLPSASASFDLC